MFSELWWTQTIVHSQGSHISPFQLAKRLLNNKVLDINRKCRKVFFTVQHWMCQMGHRSDCFDHRNRPAESRFPPIESEHAIFDILGSASIPLRRSVATRHHTEYKTRLSWKLFYAVILYFLLHSSFLSSHTQGKFWRTNERTNENNTWDRVTRQMAVVLFHAENRNVSVGTQGIGTENERKNVQLTIAY